MASGLLKMARRPTMLVSNEGLARALGGSIHTSAKRNDTDTWQVPERWGIFFVKSMNSRNFHDFFFYFRLQHIPTAERPSFFNMVEYYFHRACVVAEPSLFDMLHRYPKIWWNFSRFDEKIECFLFSHLVYSF